MSLALFFFNRSTTISFKEKKYADDYKLQIRNQLDSTRKTTQLRQKEVKASTRVLSQLHLLLDEKKDLLGRRGLRGCLDPILVT
jgi:hypothetical protein